MTPAGRPTPSVLAPAPAIGWSDLAGAAVGIWGVGVEGGASLRRLRALGATPVLVDDRPPSSTVGGLPVLPTTEGGLEALARCDVVVKSPGISRHRPDVVELAARGVAVAGGLGLWLQETDRDRVLCVTGTKGKSTTTAVAAHLLTALGVRARTAGNFGLPPWDPQGGDDPVDYWVVEVSSFQATDLAAAPPVVAVTSLGADHLDWHGDLDAYYRDKLSLCTRPGARLTVADGSSDALRTHRALLGQEVRWVAVGDPDLDGPWADGLGLLGAHNRRNALVARACLEALGVPRAGDDPALARAAAGFTGLDSRLRRLGTVAGVEFVDDSLSTNVLPTLAALDAFAGRRLALLAGGYDRGIDYAPLAARLLARAEPTFLATLPASGARIRTALAGTAGGAGGSVPASDPAGGSALTVVDAPDVAAATESAFAWARPDGVVLLSPAAPSFGQFRDYRERAAAFAEAMAACAALPGVAGEGHRVTAGGAGRGGSGSRRGPAPA